MARLHITVYYLLLSLQNSGEMKISLVGVFMMMMVKLTATSNVDSKASICVQLSCDLLTVKSTENSLHHAFTHQDRNVSS